MGINESISEDGVRHIRTTKIILCFNFGIGTTVDYEEGLTNAEVRIRYWMLPFVVIKDYRIKVFPPENMQS